LLASERMPATTTWIRPGTYNIFLKPEPKTGLGFGLGPWA
jgi:hypothetical protein